MPNLRALVTREGKYYTVKSINFNDETVQMNAGDTYKLEKTQIQWIDFFSVQSEKLKECAICGKQIDTITTVPWKDEKICFKNLHILPNGTLEKCFTYKNGEPCYEGINAEMCGGVK